jgi:putative transposase
MRIDQLHMDWPYAGAHMLSWLLKRDGVIVGRRHVSTLMKLMGIEAFYRKPNTRKKHLSYSLAGILWFKRQIRFRCRASRSSTIVPATTDKLPA